MGKVIKLRILTAIPKKGCSDHCKCKSCENPHGKRGLIESPLKKKRRRHEWQLATQRSSTFARETLNFGSRSLLEFFALEQVLSHCIRMDIETNSDNIAKIYNAMVEISRNEEYLPLPFMSQEKVTTFLKEHEKNRVLFKASHLYLEYDNTSSS